MIGGKPYIRILEQVMAQNERLLDRNEDLMDRLQEMVGTVHHHQVRQYAAPDQYVPDVNSPNASLYTSEDEQDARYQQEAGLITQQELEAALAEMQFANSEIETL